MDVLLPAACAGCGRYGAALCDACSAAFRPASRAEDRFLAPDPGVVVGDALELAIAAFAYEGPTRRTLARLKYGGAARLARPLAAAALPWLDALLRALPAADGVTLVPVPVHAERLRQRGYNQAALLARQLGAGAGRPVAELLVRRRATTQQHRLDRSARLRNLREAFALAPPPPARAQQPALARPPPAVVLIDDILTTSATLEACAAVLAEGGAGRIWGFAIAREL
jgi:ComF family protein